MTIEFQCGACQQTLAVPDEIGGKQAKCPNCAAVLEVPQAPASANPLLAAGAAQSFGPTEANPYGAPMTQPSMPQVSGQFGPGNLDAGLALSTAWKLFQANAGILIGATVVMFGVSMVISQANQFLMMIMVEGAGGQPGPGFFAVFGIGTLLGQIVNCFLMIGMFRLCIAIGRNERAEFGMLFSGMPFLLPFLLVYLAFSFITTIGFLLLIAPGVYLILTYWPAMWLSIDRKTGFGESFSLAGTLTPGNRGDAFLMGLIASGLSILGALMCFVGLLATMPIAYQMAACGYLMMTNQKYDGNLS